MQSYNISQIFVILCGELLATECYRSEGKEKRVIYRYRTVDDSHVLYKQISGMAPYSQGGCLKGVNSLRTTV